MEDKTAITETSTERRKVCEYGHQILCFFTHTWITWEVSLNWPTFRACKEGTPPHKENWKKPGARRLTRSKWSSESPERVRKEQCSTSKPSPTDQAYYPTTADIHNHMYKAKVALQLSKYDQENLAWKLRSRKGWIQIPVSLTIIMSVKQTRLKPGVERLLVGLIWHKLCYGFISNRDKGTLDQIRQSH